MYGLVNKKYRTPFITVGTNSIPTNIISALTLLRMNQTIYLIPFYIIMIYEI